VNILTRSGYKGFVAARLARQGEKPHTREKLEYEIRQMIKVWYHPDDPRFEDVDLADDAMPGNDGRSETVPEETAAAIVAVAERELAREADEQPAYPPVMAKIIYDFRECYNERSRQHRMLAGLGETNTQAVCTPAQGYCRPYSLSLQPHDTAGCHQKAVRAGQGTAD